MNGIKLYELADEARVLDEFLLETEGELTPEIEELLDKLETDITTKAGNVALYIRQLLVTAAAVKLEEERLSARRKQIERAADGLKGYLQRNLERLGKTKIEAPTVTVALQANPPSVVGDVPAVDLESRYKDPTYAEFIRYSPAAYALDRKAILAAYKTHAMIPFSDHLRIERGVSLRIR